MGRTGSDGVPATWATEIFLFGSLRLDRRRALLSRRDERDVFVPLSVGSRALSILGLLVERPGDLVTRAEIMAAVWPGAAVEDSNLNVQIAALRRVLDEGGTEGSFVQTVPGRGYRFIAEVTRVDSAPLANTTAVQTSAVLPLPDKPSLAVMPFQNMSGDPEQDYFADGMVEEIITALSRIRWLFVIARNSSFAYKGKTLDVRQMGRELGVRYVLEGAVRKAGGRLRISVQLIDARSGTHLWADRFDGALEDVFNFQDQVAASVAGVIEPALQAAETARSADRPTNDLTAYDLYLRAYEMYFSSAEQIPEALRLLERAIERDPRYGPALAWASVCCLRLGADGSSTDPVADRRKSVDYARRGLQIAGGDPAVLANAALALAYYGEDIGAMMRLVDRALALNPSFARGWYIGAILRMFAGEFDRAIEFAEASLRLSPHGRIGQIFNVIGASLLFTRRFDEALPMLLLAIEDDPSFPTPYRYLAVCYAHMGRLDEARAVTARMSSISSSWSDADCFRDAAHREFYLSGLRLATREIE
jgi:TolB-like protein